MNEQLNNALDPISKQTYNEFYREICGEGTLDSTKSSGKIVVCLRGVSSREAKSNVAAQAGAVGMILVNDEQSGNDIFADPHIIPATNVNYNDSISISQYISSTT